MQEDEPDPLEDRSRCSFCHGHKPFDMRHMGILSTVCPRCKGTGKFTPKEAKSPQQGIQKVERPCK